MVPSFSLPKTYELFREETLSGGFEWNLPQNLSKQPQLNNHKTFRFSPF